MDRVTLGKMQNPVRGFLHGVGAVASAIGLTALVVHVWGDGTSKVTGAFVFGISLVAMYVISALYHSIPWRERTKAWMQRVDHSMIFLVVAGTITPVAISALDGGALLAALLSVWGLAVTGIVLKFVLKRSLTWLSITLQMVMGSSLVFWLPRFFDRFGWAVTWPILAGGAAYTAGMIIFATKRPRLFPRVFSSHELFHVLVITASSLHFAAVWQVL